MNHHEGANNRQMPVLIRSHIERCLQQVWEQSELHVDDDGDWPYRWGAAMCWVRFMDDQAQSGVRVFAYAAYGVKPTAAVLREINELNGRARWVRFVQYGDAIAVEGELHWTQIEPAALDRLLQQVARAADDVGALFAAVHGGQTPGSAVDDDEDSTELALGDDDEEAA